MLGRNWWNARMLFSYPCWFDSKTSISLHSSAGQTDLPLFLCSFLFYSCWIKLTHFQCYLHTYSTQCNHAYNVNQCKRTAGLAMKMGGMKKITITKYKKAHIFTSVHNVSCFIYLLERHFWTILTHCIVRHFKIESHMFANSVCYADMLAGEPNLEWM